MDEPKTARLQVETRKLEDLRPHPSNPRLHPHAQVEKLRDSLDRFGFIKGSIVVSPDGTIITGHGIYEALEAEGYQEADVIVADLDEGLMAAFLLADNKLGEESRWDMPLLNALFAELEDMGVEMEATAFEMEEIEEIRHEDNAVYEDEFDVDGAMDEDVVMQTGDLWHLGNHRLLCSDSTDPESVKRLMDGEKAVLMATDPPYGDSWVQKAKDMAAHGYGHSRAELHGSIASDDLSVADLKIFLDAFLECGKLAGDPPMPVYVWHRAKRMVFEQALVDAGYLVHQPVIWVKPGFVIGRLHYHPRCEWALHGWRQGNGKCPFYGERNQSDIWEIGRENDKIHPTQKPIELFAIPIRNHTKVGEICYEPFAGSGTQFIAADMLERLVYGLELEPRYCDVIIKRYINHVGTAEEVWVEREGAKLMWDEIA